MRNGSLSASSGSAGNSGTKRRQHKLLATRTAAAATCETMERRVLLSVTPAITAPPPATVFSAEAVAISATEGITFSGTVATFGGDSESDPAADYTASVNWGDGTTTTGSVSGSIGNFTVAGSHEYADIGYDTVTVVITNTADEATGTATGTATVAPQPETYAPITVESVAITATEFSAFTGTVATFTDLAAEPTADYAASIDWGDGTTTNGTVSGSSGSYTVAGSHTYSQDGLDSVTVSVTDTVNSFSGSAIGDATVSEAPITGTVSFSPTQGGFTGEVATFSETGSTNPASDYTAEIQWGDGGFTSGTVSGSNGSYTVSGSHSYTEEGTMTAVVSLSETGELSDPATATGNVTVADANTLTPTGTAISATEGSFFDGNVASFGDTFTDAQSFDFTASINWGDGSSASLGEVGGGGGQFTVGGDHEYADAGTFTVSATLSENSPGTAVATATSSATVAADLSGTVALFNVTEGGFSGEVANFTEFGSNDPASDYTANIDWGDGTTTAGTVSGSDGDYTVSGSHSYADVGEEFPTVTFTQAGVPDGTATASGEAEVADANNLAGASAATLTATEGVSTGKVVLGTFSDTGYPGNSPGDFSATIVWGDATSSAGTVSGGSGTFTVSGSHVYADLGTFEPAVSISEDPPGFDNANVTAIVTVSPGEATPTLSTTREPAAGTVGATFADKATVSGGDSPTGNVTFDLYGNSSGTGTPLFTNTQTLSGGAATSKGFIIPSAGTDYWVVTYGGDSNNNLVTSNAASEPVVVSKAVPAFSSLTSPTILIHASSVTLGGHISAGSLVPGGSVSITLNGVTKSASIGSSGNFSVAFSTASLPVEPYTVKYAFAGNSNYGPASASSALNVIYGVHYTVTPNPPSAHGPPTDQVHIVLVDANGANVIAPANAVVTATGYALAATPSKVKALPADNPNPKFSRFAGEDHFDYTLALPGVAAGQYVLFFTITGDPTLHQLAFTVM